MDKRHIDPIKLEQSKQRTIHTVMERLSPIQKPSPWKRIVLLPTIISFVVLGLLFVSTTDPDSNTNPDYTYLSTESYQTIAEIAYISSGLIPQQTTTSSIPNTMSNTETDDTEFEKNIDDFNTYFSLLKVFLEDQPLIPTINESEDEITMSFIVLDEEYTFVFTLVDDQVTGTVFVLDKEYQLTGLVKEEEDEITIDLEARQNDDFIEMKYQSEGSLQLEKKYRIISELDGVRNETQVKLSKEGTEQKVDIEENDDSYTLKKEISNGNIEYKLTYEVNGIKGDVRITETILDSGEREFEYRIKENGKEKNVTKNNSSRSNNKNKNEFIMPNQQQVTQML